MIEIDLKNPDKIPSNLLRNPTNFDGSQIGNENKYVYL